MRIKRGQKWYQSRGLPLRRCRQGHFYIFNQAPSFNLQKFTQRRIGRNWGFSLNGHQILFFYCRTNFTFYGRYEVHPMHAHAVHAHVMHGPCCPLCALR
jgi:hypothetical protein